MTEIVLNSTILPDGSRRYDLIGKDLPGNFLGLGADLNFERQFAEGEYLEMEEGEVFAALSSSGRPIILAKTLPEKGKLVFGITRKVSDVSDLPDGVLASFRVTGSMPAAENFTQSVLSVFDNGRRDLPDVVWSVTKTISTQDKQTGSTLASSRSLSAGDFLSSGGGANADLSLSASTTFLPNEAALWEVLNTPVSATAVGFWAEWWWLLGAFVLLLAGALMLFIFKFGKRVLGGGWPEAGREQIKLDY